MITKLLIANRGEIACRVMKTAKSLGIHTVAVYSDADINARHVQMADEAVCLGAAPSKDSYLKADDIIAHAKRLGVDAIHPGYGFLSENAGFANACEDNDIIFVGPPASAIEAMGSKSAAKHIMEKAGVPLVPGYHGDDQSPAVLKKAADDMGYPVLLKAAAGGGGKGMRQVWSEDEFSHALDAAKRESMASFGDDHMLVEKYLTRPRHVEFQVFCDKHGNGVYLFERDCSVQRRHQKIIEEAPAPNMSVETRKKMGEAALLAAKAINYVGAGTVEFLLDEDDSFYFMEMNTRLQVEHPVTEMITGEDLVHWQLLVAEGNVLPKAQEELTLSGHAFEARIYAEDPDNDFLPATGRLALLKPPHESDVVRVDTGVVQGDEVSVYYDPMIAKLVVWGADRDIALKRLLSALGDYHISGLTTNIDFLMRVAGSKPFINAELTTTFVDKHSDMLFTKKEKDLATLLPTMTMLALANRESVDTQSQSPWDTAGSWRANMAYRESMVLRIDDTEHNVTVSHTPRINDNETATFTVSHNGGTSTMSGYIDGQTFIAIADGTRTRYSFSKDENTFGLYSQSAYFHFDVLTPDLGGDASENDDANLTAPMNGTVVATLVAVGEKVAKGTPIMIMEAMKMEHTISAPADGAVSEFFFSSGELVDGGATLLAFDKTNDEE